MKSKADCNTFFYPTKKLRTLPGQYLTNILILHNADINTSNIFPGRCPLIQNRFPTIMRGGHAYWNPNQKKRGERKEKERERKKGETPTPPSHIVQAAPPSLPSTRSSRARAFAVTSASLPGGAIHITYTRMHTIHMRNVYNMECFPSSQKKTEAVFCPFFFRWTDHIQKFTYEPMHMRLWIAPLTPPIAPKISEM